MTRAVAASRLAFALVLALSCADDEGGGPCGPFVCLGTCVDLMTNEANCGRCGAGCATGQECLDGRCVHPAVGARIQCADEVVNTANDPEHCGACFSTCDREEICLASACVPGCAGDGVVMCGGRCVALASDEDACGACGNACVPGAICTDGSCTCLSGLTRCSDACTDVMRDERHCGACDASCDGTCVDGVCSSVTPFADAG